MKSLKKAIWVTISIAFTTWWLPNALLVSGHAGSMLESRTVAQRNDRITATNWRQHPQIKAIRSMVDTVNAELAKGTLKISVRNFEYCEPYQDTMRKMAVDAKGVVRSYVKQAGSEDSSLNWHHYYDENGRLRFAFIFGGATNGAKLEHRIYFDESGRRIWEEQKYLKGPQYFFPKVWPDDLAGKAGQAPPVQKSDPAKAFSANSQCPEVKKDG
jgi:hypothetical protein